MALTATNRQQLGRLEELHEELVTGRTEIDDIAEMRPTPKNAHDGEYYIIMKVQEIINRVHRVITGYTG